MEFTTKLNEIIEFICIICKSILHEKLAESSNLNSHLKYNHASESDKTLFSWFKEYNKTKIDSNKKGYQILKFSI